VELFFDKLIKAFELLKELGFTYYNGKVCSIDIKEDQNG